MYMSMIRKVPNAKAWILKKSDILNLRKVYNAGFLYVFSLPLFDVDPSITFYNSADSDIILVTTEHPALTDNVLFENSKFKPEYIDIINKIWNTFYET